MFCRDCAGGSAPLEALHASSSTATTCTSSICCGCLFPSPRQTRRCCRCCCCRCRCRCRCRFDVVVGVGVTVVVSICHTHPSILAQACAMLVACSVLQCGGDGGNAAVVLCCARCGSTFLGFARAGTRARIAGLSAPALPSAPTERMPTSSNAWFCPCCSLQVPSTHILSPRLVLC